MKRLKESYPVYICAWMGLFFGMGASSIMSVYLNSIGKAPTELSRIMSASNWFAIALLPLTGMAADRIRHPKRLASVLLAVATAATFTFGIFTDDFALFILYGIMMGMISSVNVLAERLAGAGRYRYGQIRIWGTIGYAVSAQVCGWILDKASGRTLFSLISACQLIGALAFLMITDLKRQEGPEDQKDVPVVDEAAKPKRSLAQQYRFLKDPRFLLYILLIFLLQGCTQGSISFVPLLLEKLSVSRTLIGTFLSLGTLVELPMVLFSNKFMDKVPPRTLLIFNGCLAVGQFLVYGLTRTALPAVLVVIVVKSICSTLIMMVNLKMVNLIVSQESVSSAMGFYSMTNSISLGLMQLISGHLIEDLGIQSMYLIYAGISAVAVILSFFIKVKNTKSVFT